MWFYIKVKPCPFCRVQNSKEKWRPRGSKQLVPVQCPVHKGSARILWLQCNYCVMAKVCCHEAGFPFWATSQVAQFNTLNSPIELCRVIPLGKPPSAVGSTWQGRGSLEVPSHPGSHRARVVMYHRAAVKTPGNSFPPIFCVFWTPLHLCLI